MHIKINTSLLIVMLIVIPFGVKSQELGNPNCDSLLLVSSWFSDNVKIYDGCDGTFIRDLDSQSVLDGPQAIFVDKNKDVIVVSEQNHKLVKFDRQTLSQATVVLGDDPTTSVVEPHLVENPLAVAFDSQQNIILGGFSENEIVKINPDNWQQIQTILPVSTQFIRGLDIGISIGPDGQLYVPGFDSNNIIKINLSTLAVTEVVSAGAGGLDAPRSIVFHNNQMYVTGWRNNAILRYDSNGNFMGNFVSVNRPTGMTKDGDNYVLVASDRTQANSVIRINLNNGSKETVVSVGAGNLNGATFVLRLDKQADVPAEPDAAANQHWVIGVGEISGNNIEVKNLSTTRGGAFGADFNADEITTVDWGSLSLEFIGCNQAIMSYQSFVQVDDLEFGNGGYDLFRLVNNSAVQQCFDEGFENIMSKGWMSGTWFGGASRSGEGFLLDVLDDSSVVVTMYSYLPKAQTL
ncbi:MAG: hypothetical protein JKY19_05275 [Alcanivoracaceae bacterium]|nr:hypothetical protein [Alcanivoracaceae bacterium]